MNESPAFNRFSKDYLTHRGQEPARHDGMSQESRDTKMGESLESLSLRPDRATKRKGERREGQRDTQRQRQRL